MSEPGWSIIGRHETSRCSSHAGGAVWRPYLELSRNAIVAWKWIGVLATLAQGICLSGLSR